MDSALNPVDGTRIAYRVTAEPGASGTPVVLAHGTALSKAIWRGFGYLRALAPDRPVIVVDLRGHGSSGKPHEADAYAMDRFVGDMVAVLDAAGVERAHFAGYSLGGRLGFSLAASHPERLASLTSLAGAPATGVGVFDRVFFEGSIEALEKGGMSGFLEEWRLASGAEVDAATRAAFLANDPVALAAYMRAAEAAPRVTDAEIERFAMPVLLVAGTRDRSRLVAAEHVHALLPEPRSELVVLDGATHADTPRQPAVPGLVRDFLTRADAA
ncbi:alpha/beta fold hydrolase [Herbiconiux moechotypicola]|uniref:Alpha/beta hydrolase n=1 Tax=Herbiconiux moechotypicola TaxID=637393 RepID=A0ABN3DI91_9MICO|nr:alpha/beta fold hydrolase [Herbiconiux moechotypicola]MCS5729726.1 alpha/beta fold hydrolase [Herbiconiux moechotypicola]